MARKRGIGQYFELEYLTESLILKNLVFVIFLGSLAILYIANGHFAERNVRQIQHLQKELKELRWYYLTLEAENMYNSRRSELAERLRQEGFVTAPVTPRRIVVRKKDYKHEH